MKFLFYRLWSTKDDCCLYMLFEYVCGGELFTYLRNAGRFSASAGMFWFSSIYCNIIYT